MENNLKIKINSLLLRETQKEVAKRLGVSTSTIKRWKNGKVKNPSKKHLTKLNRVIGGLKSKNIIKQDSLRVEAPTGDSYTKTQFNKELKKVLKYNENLKIDEQADVHVIYDGTDEYKDQFGITQNDEDGEQETIQISTPPIKLNSQDQLNSLKERFIPPPVYEIRVTFNKTISGSKNAKKSATKKTKNKKSK